MESLSPAPGSEVYAGERRKLPRVSISSEQFRLSNNGKVYAVADLSPDGMALRLLDRQERVLFPLGTRVEGWLNIARKKYKITSIVRNIRGDHVGCEFHELSSEIREELLQWLDPTSLGQTLRLMPSPVGFGATGSGQFDWLWFHGRSGTEVFARVSSQNTEMDSRSICSLVVVLWGEHFVEWVAEDGVVTGRLRLAEDRDAIQGVFRLAPEWFERDSELDPIKLNLAKTLVLSASFPEHWKKVLASALATPH